MNPPSGLLHRKNTSTGFSLTQSIAGHFAKKAPWPPRAIRDRGRPRLRESILSKFACQPVVQAQCPTSDDQDCSDAILVAHWNWRLASCSVHGGIGKFPKPHWICDSFVAPCQTNPRHSIEPNQQWYVTFCAAIRWYYLTALLSMPTCANWEAWLVWQQH